MATTFTQPFPSRTVGNFRVETYKAVQGTGGSSVTVDAEGLARAIYILGPEEVAGTIPGATELLDITVTDPITATVALTNQPNSSTRYFELWYGAGGQNPGELPSF